MAELLPAERSFRTFLALWATQSVSQFGSQIAHFALAVWLAQVRYGAPGQEAELALALTALGLASLVPWVVTAPLLGVWVDQHDRKHIMLLANLVGAAGVAVEAFLLALGQLELWVLVITSAFLSISNSIHGSALLASTQMLVPDAHRARASALNMASISASGIVAPALAAGLITAAALPNVAVSVQTSGVITALVLDALSFLLVAAVLPFLRVPSPEPPPVVESWGNRVLAGVRFIRAQPALLWLLLTFTVFNFAGAPLNTFYPLIVRIGLAADWTVLGLTFEAALALLVSARAAGGVAGSVLVSAWGGLKRQRMYGVLVPVLLLSIVQVAFGLVPWCTPPLD